jgi:hypothetical protein
MAEIYSIPSSLVSLLSKIRHSTNNSQCWKRFFGWHLERTYESSTTQKSDAFMVTFNEPPPPTIGPYTKRILMISTFGIHPPIRYSVSSIFGLIDSNLSHHRFPSFLQLPCGGWVSVGLHSKMTFAVRISSSSGYRTGMVGILDVCSDPIPEACSLVPGSEKGFVLGSNKMSSVTLTLHPRRILDTVLATNCRTSNRLFNRGSVLVSTREGSYSLSSPVSLVGKV